MSETKLVWDFINSIWICGGVIAALLAILKTSNWSRRQGISTMDFGIIPIFICYTARYLGLVFFIVIFLGLFFVAITYTGAPTMPWTLDGPLTNFVKIYIAVAFGLRALDIFLRIVRQSMAEVFIMDWERPRAHETEVGAWRTYLVAQRWLGLLTRRRVNPVLLYSTAYLILAWSSLLNHVALVRPAADANNLTAALETSSAPLPVILIQHPLNRFVAITCTIFAVALVYYFTVGALIERFHVHPLYQLIDLCSLCNVSILVFSHRLYGYYIHRGALSSSSSTTTNVDTAGHQTLQDILLNNKNRNFQPQSRGDAAGDDNNTQTFCLSVSEKFREIFSNLVESPTSLAAPPHQQVPSTIASALTPFHGVQYPAQFSTTALPWSSIPPRKFPAVGGALTTQSRAETYTMTNKFLKAFIEPTTSHTTPLPVELSYTLRQRSWLEAVLDAEFRRRRSSTKNGCVLYSDASAHAFGSLFLRGIEIQLWIFECLLFLLIELNTGSLALATVVVLMSAWATSTLRDTLGRMFMWRHALLDERLLT